MKTIEKLSTAIFRKKILEMTAYQVAEADGFIKLDAMENPYGWPNELTEAWLKTLRNCEINRYPDPDARHLSNKLREMNEIPTELGILLGNGSDEIIQLLLMALPSTAPVMAPDPSFVMYKQISDGLELNFHAIPLQENNFALDLPRFLQSIKAIKPKIIFLAYPNNPTGNLFNTSDIQEIINHAPGLVVIDEAYAPFTDATFMSKISGFDNLLVMRTVSKLGLAGLRLGYLVGQNEIIKQLNKIRLPYNINVLTQVSTLFALSNYAIFEQQTQLICQERAALTQALKNMPQLEVFPSDANFILFRVLNQRAHALFTFLKDQQILIKSLANHDAPLTNCLRVTVGKKEENSVFLTALSQYFSRLNQED
jgi:histidinol phosphate aminotransferase apoenzyme (EC 2.6.1.9)